MKIAKVTKFASLLMDTSNNHHINNFLETKQKKLGNMRIFCEAHQFCVQQEALDQKFKKKSHTK
jgi:hypothetical protein